MESLDTPTELNILDSGTRNPLLDLFVLPGAVERRQRRGERRTTWILTVGRRILTKWPGGKLQGVLVILSMERRMPRNHADEAHVTLGLLIVKDDSHEFLA